MFGRRKEELAILQKSIENVEKSQQNTELIVSKFTEFIESINSSDVIPAIEHNVAEKQIEEQIEYEDQRRAAYALNLCTVSVSQIVDYNDINILEQEYDTILNNLNLEKMPNDEALLNILKQIMDTVTFFRIQEGDKKIFEKEYQQRMKDAIWSAVPNIAVFVQGGNPFTAIASLATQVGIGYMSYRKEKSRIGLEKEQREWQLQRTALEQFNGLRRELFDTAWRLSKRYGIKEELRLTENQIKQYNAVLMDSNELRKYERLEAMSLFFEAYPEFWYQIGHAAHCVSISAYNDYENKTKAEYKNENYSVYVQYREKAKQFYKKYLEQSKYSLLREDQITSSCALEYVDLLDIEKDCDEIKDKIDLAIKMSGYRCDILQLCAFAYLKIGVVNPNSNVKLRSAVEILRYLVNEKYNPVVNAQILSSIYVHNIIAKENILDNQAEYRLLSTRIIPELLYPYPSAGDEINLLEEQFIFKQRESLIKEYCEVISNYCEKCSIEFNSIIPPPSTDKEYHDSFFSDKNQENRTERLNQYEMVFSSNDRKATFLSALSESDYIIKYVELFNKIVNDVKTVIFQDKGNYDYDIILESMIDAVNVKIGESKDKIAEIQDKLGLINEACLSPFNEFKKLVEYSFGWFTAGLFEILLSHETEYISGLTSMNQFSKCDSVLRSFCIKHGLPEYNCLYEVNYDYEDSNKDTIYFSANDFGSRVQRRSNEIRIAHQMTDYILKKSVNWKNIRIIMKYDENTKNDYKDYFDSNSHSSCNDMKNFAVIKDSRALHTDIIISIEGLTVHKMIGSDIRNISFSEIVRKENGIKLKDYIYNPNGINYDEFIDIIQGLNSIYIANKNIENSASFTEVYQKKLVNNGFD